MKDLTITVGRIAATRQGPSSSSPVPGFALRGFHGTVPYAPTREQLWPAAADVLCDELAKIREALLAAKSLLDSSTFATRATLAQLLAELEVA